MHVVAIRGWKKETPELAQALAGALGVTPFEARQRLIGGGPAIVAGLAALRDAQELTLRLSHVGIPAYLLDSAAVRNDGRLYVRRLVLEASQVQIETGDGDPVYIPYAAVDLILAASGTITTTDTHTITERKFSLGKTMLMGGIPMTKTVKREEEVTTEERRKYLFVYAKNHPLVVFGLPGMKYDGLGSLLELSQEGNFGVLVREMRQRAGKATYDDRLINRSAFSHLLGSVRSTDMDIDLAVAVLAKALRP